eukprot:jgi/Mesvir1/24383/Mv11052-RA.1
MKDRRRLIYASLVVIVVIRALAGAVMHAWNATQLNSIAAPGKPLSGTAAVPATTRRPRCDDEATKRAAAFQPAQVLGPIPGFLTEYAAFHRREMQKAMRGPAFARQVRFLVYVCDPGHCGGLGDRFKGIISAFYLAVFARRVFLIQHPSYPLSDFLAPHAIDWASWGECVDPFVNRDAASVLDGLLPARTGVTPRYVLSTTKFKGRLHAIINGDLLIADASNTSVPYFHALFNTPAWDDIVDAEAARINVERFTGAPWSAPSGPRFAWAWHFLFHPSQELQRHMARLRTQLHIPGDGSPWVAAHIRVGNSQGFKDKRRSTKFCTLDEGGSEHAKCAAHLAGIASQPPFATRGDGYAVSSSTSVAAGQGHSGSGSGVAIGQGHSSSSVAMGQGSLDPNSIPIFIASDNEEATQRMHAHLVAGGHRGDAVRYSGRKAVHVDNMSDNMRDMNATSPTERDRFPGPRLSTTLGGASSSQGNAAWQGDPSLGATAAQGDPSASDLRSAFMHTLTDLLLLSQATCLVTGGDSGFSGVAMMLSRDRVTGARCFSFGPDVGKREPCSLYEETDPRRLARGDYASAAVTSAGITVPNATNDRDLLPRTEFRACSAILTHGGRRCPKPLAVDIEAHLVVRGPELGTLMGVHLNAAPLQEPLASLFGFPDPCHVDVLFSRRGVPAPFVGNLKRGGTWLDYFVTLTLYVDNASSQRNVARLAGVQRRGVRGALAEYLGGVLDKRVKFQFVEGLNITLIDQRLASPAPSRIVPHRVATLPARAVSGTQARKIKPRGGVSAQHEHATPASLGIRHLT